MCSGWGGGVTGRMKEGGKGKEGGGSGDGGGVEGGRGYCKNQRKKQEMHSTGQMVEATHFSEEQHASTADKCCCLCPKQPKSFKDKDTKQNKTSLPNTTYGFRLGLNGFIIRLNMHSSFKCEQINAAYFNHLPN